MPPPFTLNTALQRVRENSPRLRQARETLQAAEARTEGSRSGWYPHLSAVADYSYRGLVSEYEGIKFMPNNSYNARVGAEMTLLDFGRTAKGVAIARSGEKLPTCRSRSRDGTSPTPQSRYSTPCSSSAKLWL